MPKGNRKPGRDQYNVNFSTDNPSVYNTYGSDEYKRNHGEWDNSSTTGYGTSNTGYGTSNTGYGNYGSNPSSYTSTSSSSYNPSASSYGSTGSSYGSTGSSYDSTGSSSDTKNVGDRGYRHKWDGEPPVNPGSRYGRGGSNKTRKRNNKRRKSRRMKSRRRK